MSGLEPSIAPQSSKAADLIDQKLAKFAATLEGISESITNVGAKGDVPADFANMATRQIEALNSRVQSIDSGQIIARSKDTINRHPAALTLFAAVAGATIAQVALFVVRNEISQPLQMQKSEA